MKSIYLIACFCLFTLVNVVAQDPNFSMFYNNPVYYNPAMTAINNGLTLRGHYRNLWTPIISKFNTYSASAEIEAVNKIGFGIMALGDVAGEGLLRTNSLSASYMYRPIENENFMLQVGFSGGFVSKYVDWTKLVFSDQLDEVHGQIRESVFIDPNFNSVLYADFGAGAAAKFNARANKAGNGYKKMNGTVGFAFHHLTRPKDAFFGEDQKLPMKAVVHSNINIQVNQTVLSPSVIFERQNKFQTFTLGLNVAYNPFFAGIWFRKRSFISSGNQFDAFILTTGTNLKLGSTQKMRISYSFDLTVSRLRSASIGTQELSLIFFFDDKLLFKKMRNQKRIKDKYKCPEGFEGI